MCDYSLEGYKSRQAEIGDTLIIGRVHGFMETKTNEIVEQKLNNGTQLSADDVCLTCLKPGTRLSLTNRYDKYDNVEFVQSPGSGYRDYVVLNGRRCAVADLPKGTTATVLSIPGVTDTRKGVEVVNRALDEHDKLSSDDSQTQATPELVAAK